MPPARIHEAIAKEVNKGHNELLLRIGTVAPDSWRNIVTNKKKYITHFWDFRVKDKKQANDYQEFYLKYYKYLDNPFYFGYLIHLIVDQYWKSYIDPKYRVIQGDKVLYRLKNGSLREDVDYWEYHDSIKMQKQVAKIYNLGELPINKSDYPGFKCNIDEINVGGLFGLKGTLNYINSTLLPDGFFEESEIYDIEQLLIEIKETKKFVEQELERLKRVKEEFDKKVKIAVDIDDTILCTQELVDFYWKEFLDNNPQIENKKYKWGDPELAYFWAEYREKIAFGKIKTGVSDALKELIKKGYKVDLVSARPLEQYASLKKKMVEYFEQNDISYDYLNIGLYEKKYFLQEHGYDILIDNDIRHMIEAEEIGISSILYSSFNDEYKGFQTSNWEEIPYMIDEIIKNKVKK